MKTGWSTPARADGISVKPLASLSTFAYAECCIDPHPEPQTAMLQILASVKAKPFHSSLMRRGIDSAGGPTQDPSCKEESTGSKPGTDISITAHWAQTVPVIQASYTLDRCQDGCHTVPELKERLDLS